MTTPSSTPPFVVAVDAGGTATRVGCYALDGTLLSSATGAAGAAHHDDDAARNLTDAVSAALTSGGLDPAAARGLTAGVAGIGRPGSNQGVGRDGAWAASFYPLDLLDCPRTFVNDAVVAHRGALLDQAGIVVVAGTGSMVLAIDENGVEVESGQFQHYAGAARHVAFDVVHQVLAGRAEPADGELVARVLEHWGAADVDALRLALRQQDDVAHNDVKRAFGSFAPVVTKLADTSPLADRALRRLADVTADGVLLLAPLLRDTPVPVSLAGSLALDPAFSTRLDAALDVPGATPVHLAPPALDPLGGAGFLALRRLGAPLGPEVVRRLGSSG
ncbi:BadF/BadG/BcrA/BcrD ATPase family protein [Kineococcus sp. GCM10028916]|uniref:BadF/BadG/BcrA/BcrD ATPase family protein n=1 Tax=Kineococcus sp. GCM10028916 TaxID=3273394 RepID=UPI00363A13FB